MSGRNVEGFVSLPTTEGDMKRRTVLTAAALAAMALATTAGWKVHGSRAAHPDAHATGGDEGAASRVVDLPRVAARAGRSPGDVGEYKMKVDADVSLAIQA